MTGKFVEKVQTWRCIKNFPTLPYSENKIAQDSKAHEHECFLPSIFFFSIQDLEKKYGLN